MYAEGVPALFCRTPLCHTSHHQFVSTDRSGAETEYPCALAHLVLLRIKLDTPSACCGVFDSLKL